MDTKSRIKKDLWDIRKSKHYIATLQKIVKKQEQRVQEDNVGEIKTILVKKINQTTDKEIKYLKMITELLCKVDQIIVMEAFFEGTPYWKIGQKVGYSEDGIKKRIKNAITSLAKNKKLDK